MYSSTMYTMLTFISLFFANQAVAACSTFISEEVDSKITDDVEWNAYDALGFRFVPRAQVLVAELRFKLPVTNTVPSVNGIHMLLWDEQTPGTGTLLAEVVLDNTNFDDDDKTLIGTLDDALVLEKDSAYVISAYHDQSSGLNFRFTTTYLDPSNEHIEFTNQTRCKSSCNVRDIPNTVDDEGLRGLVDFCYSVITTPTPTASPTLQPTSVPTMAPTMPPFRMTSAAFSSTGAEIIFEFTDDMNGESVFPESSSIDNCEEFFAGASDRRDIGVTTATAGAPDTQPRCWCPDSMRCRVVLGSGARVVPESTELTVSNMLRRLADGAPLDGEDSTVVVSKPVNPTLPVAVLTAPSSAGPCTSANVELSAADSVNFVKRGATYHWESPNCGQFLELDTLTSTPTQAVDFTDVPVGTVCEVTLAIENFLDVRSLSSTVFITRTDVEEPQLALRSDRARPWLRNEAHNLRADLTFPACEDAAVNPDVIESRLVFQWTMVHEDGVVPEWFENVATDLSVLSIPAFVLDTQAEYTFSLTVSDDDAFFKPITQTFVVSIAHNELVAVLSGVSDISVHPVSRVLSMSAAGSFDPDYRLNDQPPGHLAYEWSCERARVSDALGDGEVESEDVLKVPANLWEPDSTILGTAGQATTASVSVASNALNADFVYRFTVDIGRVDGGVSRSDSDSAYVIPHNDNPPLVHITAPSYLSTLDTVRLLGTVEELSDDVTRDYHYQWTSSAFDLSDPDVSKFLLSPTTSKNLVIAPGLLTVPELVTQQQYAFKLEVTADGAVTGSSVAVVEVVSGPEISEFTLEAVSDEAGELVGLYEISVAATLVGDVSALVYEFGYLRDDGDGVAEFLLVGSQPSASARVFLPSGALTLFTTVSTANGKYFSQSFKNITIAEFTPTTPSCDLLSLATSVLSPFLSSQQLDESFQILQTVAITSLRDEVDVACVVDVDAFREFMYETTRVVWEFKSSHSLAETQQLALVLHSLSANTDAFTLLQVQDSLTYIERIFDAVDTSLANDNVVDGLRFARSIAVILSNALTTLRRELAELADADAGVGNSTSTMPEDEVKDLAYADFVAYEGVLCDEVIAVRSHLARLLEYEVFPLVVGEAAVTIEAENIAATALVGSIGEEVLLEHDEQSLSIFFSNEDSDTKTGSISITTFDEAVSQCFQPQASESIELAGKLVDIDIVECLAALRSSDGFIDACSYTVNNVSFTLKHESVVSEDKCAENEVERLTCSFWNETTELWSTEGCSVNLQTSDTLYCSCNHLTTFAAIAHLRRTLDDECYNVLAAVPGSGTILDTNVTTLFISIYALVFLAATYQSWRLFRYSLVIASSNGMIAHVLIAISCLVEVLSLVFSHFFVDLATYEALSAIKLSLHFTIFAMVSHRWASIYFRVIKNKEEEWRNRVLKYVFVGSTAFIMMSLLTALVVMATSDTSSRMFNDAVIIGSALVAVVSIVVAAVYLFFGVWVLRIIIESSQQMIDRPEVSPGMEGHVRDTYKKVFHTVMFVTTAFMAESIIVLVSAASPAAFVASFAAFQTAFLTVNIVSLLAILYLFTRIVSKSKQTFDSTRSRQSSRQAASAKRLKKKEQQKAPRGKSYLHRVPTGETGTGYTSGTSAYSGNMFGGLADSAYAGGRQPIARRTTGTGTAGTHGHGPGRVYTGSGNSGFSAFSKFSGRSGLMGHKRVPTGSGFSASSGFETESSMPSFLPPTPTLVRTPASPGAPRRKSPLPVTPEIPQFDLMSREASGSNTCHLHTRISPRHAMDVPVRVRTAPLEESRRHTAKHGGPVKSLTLSRPGSRMAYSRSDNHNTHTKTKNLEPSQTTGRMYDFVSSADPESSTISFTDKQYSVNASSYHGGAHNQSFDMDSVVREPSMLRFDPSSNGSSLPPVAGSSHYDPSRGGGGASHQRSVSSYNFPSSARGSAPSHQRSASSQVPSRYYGPSDASSGVFHQPSASSYVPHSRFTSTAGGERSAPSSVPRSVPQQSLTPSVHDHMVRQIQASTKAAKPKRKGFFSFLPSFGRKSETRAPPDVESHGGSHYPYLKQPSTASCSHDDRSTPSGSAEHSVLPDMMTSGTYTTTNNYTNTNLTTDKSTTRFALSRCPPSVTAPVPPSSVPQQQQPQPQQRFLLAQPRPQRMQGIDDCGSGSGGGSIANDIDLSMSQVVSRTGAASSKYSSVAASSSQPI